jgi:hypothetical protein
MLYQYPVNLKLATSSQIIVKELRMLSLCPKLDQPPWEDRMLRGYQRTTSLREIAESIWQDNAIVGTNGSAANDHGTYSFVILTDIANE